MYCTKQVSKCLDSQQRRVEDRDNPHHGSRASKLDTMNTPYVEATETIILAKIGSSMF